MNKASLFSAVLVLSVSCVFAWTEVERCSVGTLPLAVDIHGCSRGPCDLVISERTAMDIVFMSTNFTNTMKPDAVAFVDGLRVPFPLFVNGCNGLVNGYCPIVPNEVLQFYFDMPILNYPKIDLEIEFSLRGDRNMLLNCFRVKCKVVDRT